MCPHVPQDALKEQRQDRKGYALHSSVEVYFAYIHLQIWGLDNNIGVLQKTDDAIE